MSTQELADAITEAIGTDSTRLEMARRSAVQFDTLAQYAWPEYVAMVLAKHGWTWSDVIRNNF